MLESVIAVTVSWFTVSSFTVAGLTVAGFGGGWRSGPHKVDVGTYGRLLVRRERRARVR